MESDVDLLNMGMVKSRVFAVFLLTCQVSLTHSLEIYVAYSLPFWAFACFSFPCMHEPRKLPVKGTCQMTQDKQW